MGNSEIYLKFLLGILLVVVNCVSGIVLAAFKSHLNTQEAEKKLLTKREDHQNERLAKLEKRVDVLPGVDLAN